MGINDRCADNKYLYTEDRPQYIANNDVIKNGVAIREKVYYSGCFSVFFPLTLADRL